MQLAVISEGRSRISQANLHCSRQRKYDQRICDVVTRLVISAELHLSSTHRHTVLPRSWKHPSLSGSRG